jgi:hypothetical protein
MIIASHLLHFVPVSFKTKFSYFHSSIDICSKDKKRRKMMSRQARSASPTIASHVDVEIQADSADKVNLPHSSQDHLLRKLQSSQDRYGQPRLSAPASSGSKQVRLSSFLSHNQPNNSTAIFCNVFLSGFDGTITASTYALIGSSFNAANTVSWITTSYLITTTAFQPLYGRFSDVLGRRICFFAATITFSVGCLGCGLAPNILFLNLMRGLTGLGGGGLVTMATIINSDIIPLKNRGMYQAAQNGCWDLGLSVVRAWGV